jgi:hypothetical protein
MVVDAVKKEGATFLWSGLDSYKAISGGKYPNVDHVRPRDYFWAISLIAGIVRGQIRHHSVRQGARRSYDRHTAGLLCQ